MVAVVQLVRASDCGSECRGFESHLPPNRESNFKRGLTPFFYPRFKKPTPPLYQFEIKYYYNTVTTL